MLAVYVAERGFSAVVASVTAEAGPLAFLVVAGCAAAALATGLPRGFRALSAIPTQAGCLVLDPAGAAAVALTSALAGVASRPSGERRARMVGPSFCAILAALVHPFLSDLPSDALGDAFTVTTYGLAGWLTSAVLAAGAAEQRVTKALTRHVAAQRMAVAGAGALASIAIARLLLAAEAGYLAAGVLFLLCLVAADDLAKRRALSVLVAEAGDLDRRLAHLRLMTGASHNLRNHLQNAQGALEEAEALPAGQDRARMMETARMAIADAVSAMERTVGDARRSGRAACGAVAISDVAAAAVALARTQARKAGVRLTLVESGGPAVWGDSLLLREAATNLIANAIEAAAPHGRVTVTTGLRTHGTAYLSVGDDGPGVAAEDVARLFEPHFTTKAEGTGLGLYTSRGIMLEHRGDLIYEATSTGAVFTMVLPTSA